MSDSDQTGESFDDDLLPHDPDDLVVERGFALTDSDDELFVEVDEPSATGPLAPDDEISGDETTRDIATEQEPAPAEEAAMHLDPDS